MAFEDSKESAESLLKGPLSERYSDEILEEQERSWRRRLTAKRPVLLHVVFLIAHSIILVGQVVFQTSLQAQMPAQPSLIHCECGQGIV